MTILTNPGPNWQTDLVLIGIGIAPYSARGLTQTIERIEQSRDLRRTVNGALKDVSDPLFKKYKTTISGSDVSPPAYGGLSIGDLVTVHCIVELGHDEYALKERPAVPNSERTEQGFMFYRPILECRVVNFTMASEEWTATIPWTLELEEV